MASRARRRRRRRHRRNRRIHRRTQSSYPNTLTCSSPCPGMQPDYSIKRGLAVGGTTCIAIGVVFVIQHDGTGVMKIISPVLIIFGVLMLLSLVASRRKTEFRPTYLTDVIVHPPVSSTQQQPMIPYSDYNPPPVPLRTTSAQAIGPFLPAGAPQGHFPSSGFIPSPVHRPVSSGGSLQGHFQDVRTVLSPVSGSFSPSGVPYGPSPIQGHPSGYHPGGSPQVTRYPHASRVQPFGHGASSGGHVSHHPSPFGGQNSRNPSPARRPPSQLPSDQSQSSVGDGPPSYHSVVSERPWEEPPSYVEASSCLVPRPDPEESHLPSAPSISVVSDQDPPT
ncbi:uncharacterized protein [Palaemon carinicauda]|uniref:uncharacterized protein isoform X2 n=1 Tax=Palaemon carinicauda TaxID=392227 RepID=UPI0035B6265D